MTNIIIIFAIIAGVDKLFNNRLGLGEKFDEGFVGFGGLALTIVGIYTLSPVIASSLTPILNPLSKLMNTDPSVFISSILATDLGGLSSSLEVANSVKIGEFNGVILSSMLGTTISFSVPVAVGIVSKEDFKYFSKGILAGIMTIPLGMIVGGVMMKVPFKDILFNLIPVLIFSNLIIYGLVKSQDKMIMLFEKMGSFIIKLSTIGLLLSIINYMFGIEIIKGMYPLEDAILICLNIAIILAGAYPLFYFISNKLHRLLMLVEKRFELDRYSILGLFSSMANCIPMLGIYQHMNQKGKILNAAFIVSGAFVFGGQLGYVSSSVDGVIAAFIVSKLVAAGAALVIASKLDSKMKEEVAK